MLYKRMLRSICTSAQSKQNMLSASRRAEECRIYQRTTKTLMRLSGSAGFKADMQSALRKHAYSNIQKISPPKTENFHIKNSDIFHISAQNIDWGHSLEPPRRGGSNEYPQTIFRAKISKLMYTPVNPIFTHFYCI